MPAVGAPRSFENKFAFTVEVDGVAHAGFNKCSAIKASIAVIEHNEGGSLIPNKSPGRVTWDNVTLERGAVAADSDLYDWFRQTVDSSRGLATNAAGASGVGDNDYDYKRTFDLVVRDRDGSILKRWRVVGAQVASYEAGDWDNDADEKTMEKLELAIDYAERILGS